MHFSDTQENVNHNEYLIWEVASYANMVALLA